MARIKADFVGVIHLPDHALVLKAGDEIPDGVVIGDHARQDEGHKAQTVADLQAEIDRRNDGRDEDKLIKPASTKKADLVAALEADDAAASGS